MRYFLYSYSRFSKGAKALKYHLKQKGYRVHMRDHSTWKPTWRKPKVVDTIINWGNSVGHPNLAGGSFFFNGVDSVRESINKLAAFRRMEASGVSVPRFTTDINVARDWAKDTWVVCRKLLRASGGRGIVLAKSPDEVVDAPLYVQYRRKTAEYRIHVVKGTIILAHQKRLRSKEHRGPTFNPYICNLDNAWVFCKCREPVPACVTNQAISAVAALNLDFGAVDVIFNSKFDRAYVLEVNTAPGMTKNSETITKYTEAFTR